MSSSSKNPIEVIPKEIFLKLIALLSSKDVAFASSTSKDWKEVIESDSTLFTQAEIKPFHFYIQALQDDLELDDIELYDEEMRSKAVNHLVRFVRLSRQRLRKVHIDFDLLLDYGVNTMKGDYTQNRPMSDVWTNLFLCKESLKTISFKLPVLSLFMADSEKFLPSVAIDVIALIQLIKKSLPNSIKVTITATTYLNLVSTSNSKTLSLVHCSRELEEDEAEDILTSEEDHFFFPNDHLMIQEIQDFTRNGFLKVKPERARPLSDLTLAHLSRAKESIKEIEVFGSGLDVTEAWWTHIISQAPNLSNLLLNVSQDSLEINLNASLPVVSKLQKLRLICHEVLTLNWNQHFSRWIGNQLEYLNMAWKSNAGLGLGRFSIDLDSFINFLVSCKETLQDIRLEGMGISYLPSNLDLSRLSSNNIWQSVIISNVETIKLFAAMNYSSLRRLAFEAIQDEGDVRLPYRDIIQLMRRCGHTLTFFNFVKAHLALKLAMEIKNRIKMNY